MSGINTSLKRKFHNRKNNKKFNKRKEVATPPNYHDIFINKIITICEENNITIFGSYVYEYICRRSLPCNELEIFSNSHSPSTIQKLFRLQGLRVSTDETQENGPMHFDDDYENIAFTIAHMIVGLANDELFTGRKFEVKINFIKGENKIKPPFKHLDFESNAFIWDKNGIRLSRNTGTDIDTLSPRDIKERENLILSKDEQRITSYIPLSNLSGDAMSSVYIYWRKQRLIYAVKMLEDGWTIKQFPFLQQTIASSDTCCIICQEIINGSSLKLFCCASHYHHNCFVQYACSELDDRTFVRCSQRCSEIHL